MCTFRILKNTIRTGVGECKCRTRSPLCSFVLLWSKLPSPLTSSSSKLHSCLGQTGASCLHCRGCPDTLICSYWDNTDTLLRVQTSAIALRFLSGRLDCWGGESQTKRNMRRGFLIPSLCCLRRYFLSRILTSTVHQQRYPLWGKNFNQVEKTALSFYCSFCVSLQTQQGRLIPAYVQLQELCTATKCNQ